MSTMITSCDLIVFLNSGCQKKFFPLFPMVDGAPVQMPEGNEWKIHGPLPVKLPLKDEVDASGNPVPVAIPPEFRDEIIQKINAGRGWQADREFPYLKYKLGKKKIGGVEVVGMWFAIETTQPASGENFENRGFFYDEFEPGEDDPIQSRLSQDPACAPPPIYINLQPNCFSEKRTIEISAADHTLEITFQIGARMPVVRRPVEVSLAIDFGNTRTVALFLEASQNLPINEIKTHCKPVVLKPSRSIELAAAERENIENAIISSWFILQQPEFFTSGKPDILHEDWVRGQVKGGFFGLGRPRTLVKKIKQRIPHMFVQYSPVIFGDEASSALTDSYVKHDLLFKGANIQQSSPKRYFWATDPEADYWSMIPAESNHAERNNPLKLPAIAADLFRFINEHGEYVDIDDPGLSKARRPMANPQCPRFPRSNTLIWMLVGILEKAWAQCNRHRDGVDAFRNYKLSDVIITYPSGWTSLEVQAYRRCCQAAIDIFQKTNFARSEQNIVLNMELDEAVASQLPFIFSEITGYHNRATDWIALAGKSRKGEKTVRIMNFDIGGGTSDISIIEYTNQPNVGVTNASLSATLLFKDGFSLAGDELLRKIIKDILFVAISERALAQAGVENPPQVLLARLIEVFGSNFRNANDIVKRAHITKRCLIPLALKIMSNENMRLDQSISSDVITEADWLDFSDFIGGDSYGLPSYQDLTITYQSAAVSKLIRDEFEQQFIRCGKFSEYYDIDLFFISGKPSELPEINRLANEYIRLPLERIVIAKNYRAGSWYPFANPNSNIIEEAKSVTAVGAALYHMIHRNQISNWYMDIIIKNERHEYSWGSYDDMITAGQCFQFSGETSVRILPRDVIIARKITADSVPEPVYRFRLRRTGQTAEGAGGNVEVVLRKVIREEVECLDLESVRDARSGQDLSALFELVPWQIPRNENFWQDTGKIVY